MIIVVKIGSQALLQRSKEAKPQLNQKVIASLVEQVAALKAQGHVVYIISSGAVAAGRGLWPESTIEQSKSSGKLDETAKRQILAGIGQIELMQKYKDIARSCGLSVVQVLLTKGDFISRSHYLNLERLLLNMQQFPELLPVINENDSISVEELMFTDNDQLAGVLARQLGADLLLLLTETAGVYDRDPHGSSEARLLPVLGAKRSWPKLQGKSSSGRGGIASKLDTARKMSRAGLISCIAAAHEPNILARVVAALLEIQGQLESCASKDSHEIFAHWCKKWSEGSGEKPAQKHGGEAYGCGTLVFPDSWPEVSKNNRESSNKNVRKWLSARHLADGQARIIVNAGLAQKLKGEKQVLSILPVGISECDGQFSKGDLVDIYSSEGEKLGVGQARYSSEQLGKIMAKKNQSIFIHYNYLYIENWDLR